MASEKENAKKGTKKKTSSTAKKSTSTKTETKTKKVSAKASSTKTTAKKTVKKTEPKKVTKTTSKTSKKSSTKTVPKKLKAETIKAETKEQVPVIEEKVKKEVLIENIDDAIKAESNVKNSSSKNNYVPKSVLGIELSLGGDAEDKKQRVYSYLKDATVFATIVTLFDFFAMIFVDSYTYLMITNSAALNYVLTLLIDFAIIFVVSLGIDWFLGESEIKNIREK